MVSYIVLYYIIHTPRLHEYRSLFDIDMSVLLNGLHTFKKGCHGVGTEKSDILKARHPSLHRNFAVRSSPIGVLLSRDFAPDRRGKGTTGRSYAQCVTMRRRQVSGQTANLSSVLAVNVLRTSEKSSRLQKRQPSESKRALIPGMMRTRHCGLRIFWNRIV